MEVNQEVSNNQQGQIEQEQHQHQPVSSNINQNQNISVSVENLPPSENIIEEEEGQIEDEDPEPQNQDILKLGQIQDTKDKNSYINKLQTYLSKIKQDLSHKNKLYDELNEDNKKTKETLRKVRFELLSSKQQISTLTQNMSDLQKELQTAKNINQALNKQIQVFKEAGDVGLFKEKIVELEKLLEIQKQELQIKSTMIDQREEFPSENSELSNKIQVFKLMEQHETKNKTLQQKLQLIQAEHLTLEKRLESSLEQNRKLQENNNLIEKNMATYHSKIQELEEALSKKQEDFIRRLKQSEESIMQLMQNQQIHQEIEPETQRKASIKNPQQKYGIRILTPHQQRDLILKEFIELQVKYLESTEELASLRQRHFNTLREIKNISATRISKKDYSELYKKYTKLRKCLENSLLTEQSLRNQLKNYSESNEILGYNASESQKQISLNLESKYRSIILEEPQNAINQVQKIIQKSNESQNKFFTLKQQLETKQKLIKTQKLLKEKQEKIINLQKQLQAKNNMTQLYDSELTFKNNEISLLRASHQENLQKIYDLESNSIQKNQQAKLLTLVKESQINAEILEIKNIQSIKENTTLKNEKNMLTELYNNLKTMYEELLRKEPQQEKIVHSNVVEQKSGNQIVLESQKCKECEQREEKLKNVTFKDYEAQTQGLTELYFKEIKTLLTIMKKFPTKIDDITGKLESEKSTIHEAKKKFEQVTQAYAVKYRQLDEEKKANEQWRAKQKDEIREEFQEIRELLINERLMTALKKAKSLIEYYEENAPEADEGGNNEGGNNGEIEEEVGDKNEAGEKNEVEEPIEEEKQVLE